MARTALWRLYEIAVHYAIPAPAVEPFVAIEGVEVGANVKRRGGGCLPLSLTGREDRVFAPFRVFRETPYRGTILAVLDYRRRSSMQLSEVERQYDRAFHVSPRVKPALKVGLSLTRARWCRVSPGRIRNRHDHSPIPPCSLYCSTPRTHLPGKNTLHVYIPGPPSRSLRFIQTHVSERRDGWIHVRIHPLPHRLE